MHNESVVIEKGKQKMIRIYRYSIEITDSDQPITLPIGSYLIHVAAHGRGVRGCGNTISLWFEVDTKEKNSTT